MLTSTRYKPQTISPKFPGSVRELIQLKCGDAFRHPQFQADVVRPLNIEDLLDQPVTTLSGLLCLPSFVLHENLLKDGCVLMQVVSSSAWP